MDLLDYLRALRRRWRIITALIVVAGTAAFLTTPGETAQNRVPVGTTYQATATLLRAPDVTTVDLPTIRLYISTGEIPRRVAERVQYDGPPAGLAAQVQVAGDDQVGSVTITSTSPDGDQAQRIANTFADETVAYLVDLAERNNRAALDSVNTQIDLQLKQLGNVNEALASASEGSVQQSALTAQKTAIEQSLTALFGRRTQLQTTAAATSPLNMLERAEAFPQLSSSPTVQAPQERWPRLLLGLVVGLFVGIAAALLIERLDTRLQGRESTEDAFGLPVVAEVPYLSRRARAAGSVVVVSAPESAAAEAYRTLRAALLLMPSRVLPTGVMTHPVDRGAVILVTAPTARSGKSTTSANLAACLAETGRSVLVVEADFRNPVLTRMLGAENSVGLTDIALLGDAAQLDKVIQPSKVPNVSVLPAGTRQVGGAVGNLGAIIGQARHLADIVLIDGAPVLAGSDALDLMPHVDTVVLMGRVRHTTRDQATHTRDLMTRIGVPVLGVALVGSRRGSTSPSGPSPMRNRITRAPKSRRHREGARSGRRHA